ncbi:MAG: hemolysin family protein [Planctomycetota bacterium]|jgi:CBS domain containing-hemolysin-like protein
MSYVLIAALFVVLLSALCSLSEAAFLSLPLVRARALAKIGGRTAAVVLHIRENVGNAISAIVILNTIVNVVGAPLVAKYATDYAVEAGRQGDDLTTFAAIVIASLTISVVLFGEIIPKTLGERFAATVTIFSAYPVRALMVLFGPILFLTEGLLDRLVPERKHAVTTEEEIAELANQAQREGAIRSSEAEVIQRVFRLNDFTAEDIMTPRIRCKMLPADASLKEVQEQLAQIGNARIPLFSGTRDNVTGVMRRSEALLALADDRHEMQLSELQSKTKFVPGTMTVDRVLLELQRDRQTLGVVVGEYGETIGLVTVEDIMEELVGEILDEKDVDERTIKRLSREEILVHGQTEINRINQFFNVDLSEERPTVAGLLLEELERLPETGEEHTLHGCTFTIEEANDRAIVRVRMKKLPGGSGGGDAPTEEPPVDSEAVA